MRQHERRRHGRIHLDAPLPAALDGAPVKVVDMSVGGFRIEHDARFTPLPRHSLSFEWEGRELSFRCSIMRSLLFRIARSSAERTVYHSGLKIVEPVGESGLALRNLVAQRVIRALEEQKANWLGLPPLDGFTWEPAKGDRYRRCELVDGTWKNLETDRPAQPLNGFTISADVPPRDLRVLCETYESLNAEGRRLTQILAELSISKVEGGAVRRYEP